MAETLMNWLLPKQYMGLFDDVKSSIKGSDSEANSKFNDSKFNSSFEDSQGGQQMNNDDRSPNMNNDRNPGMNNDTGSGSMRDSSLEPDSGRGASSALDQNNNLDQPREPANSGSMNNDGGYDSPNPRAGRPQEGGSEPQLSRETEKKMKNAGFQIDDNDQRGNSRNSRSGRNGRSSRDPIGNSTESVSDRRDDLEEIKSQNEQIIELLKRINDSLNGSNTRRHGGRR